MLPPRRADFSITRAASLYAALCREKSRRARLPAKDLLTSNTFMKIREKTRKQKETAKNKKYLYLSMFDKSYVTD
ncbi:hypothetical protein [Synergistes jonesii]|uniref:hypothetical protein n=1 Tax=Synergistes jonesii TaxID=2754 RepID=UPI00114CBB11|nr:hypothetical protein [Synergistes jonesii]